MAEPQASLELRCGYVSHMCMHMEPHRVHRRCSAPKSLATKEGPRSRRSSSKAAIEQRGRERGKSLEFVAALHAAGGSSASAESIEKARAEAAEMAAARLAVALASVENGGASSAELAICLSRDVSHADRTPTPLGVKRMINGWWECGLDIF